ncbi:MAG: XdhC family protein [Pyrinomonadaceae bacterium]
MNKDVDLWRSVRDQLEHDQPVVLLVVADSSGSSPGRAGYKMVVTSKGELYGSIGGGVMEVALVDQSRNTMSLLPKVVGGAFCRVVEQVHQKNAPNASGMICSGRQTVILRQLTTDDATTVKTIIRCIESKGNAFLTLTSESFSVGQTEGGTQNTHFEKRSETDFIYTERLGSRNELVIVGGGHCALALSEIAAKLGFRIRIFDDRPELNTLDKNEFADEITIVDSYETIGDHIPRGTDVYVVVMTLGYASDAVVVRQVIDHEIKYFGVLGSKAKMATLMKELREEGIDVANLERIRTPIGLPINSRTPEEIAVSIAAEIIAVKNGSELSRS